MPGLALVILLSWRGMQKSWRLGAGQDWGHGTAAGGPLSHPGRHPAPMAGRPPSWTLVGVGAGRKKVGHSVVAVVSSLRFQKTFHVFSKPKQNLGSQQICDFQVYTSSRGEVYCRESHRD